MILRYILVGLIWIGVCLVWGLMITACRFVLPWFSEMARGSFWEASIGIGVGLAFTVVAIGAGILIVWGTIEVSSHLTRRH